MTVRQRRAGVLARARRRTHSTSAAALLTDDTDWEDIRELVTGSYRILAPKKLTALLD
jgi:hypothetical protein